MEGTETARPSLSLTTGFTLPHTVQQSLSDIIKPGLGGRRTGPGRMGQAEIVNTNDSSVCRQSVSADGNHHSQHWIKSPTRASCNSRGDNNKGVARRFLGKNQSFNDRVESLVVAKESVQIASPFYRISLEVVVVVETADSPYGGYVL